MKLIRPMFAFGLGAVALSALLLSATPAHACGCFAAPDPSVPVVQAGERILFAYEEGEVIAHIQIQYEGEASEFGWLLPLPSEPTLELGVEELFQQLINQTQPRYRLRRQFNVCNGAVPASSESGRDGDFSGDDDPDSVLAFEGSIGPFDFAVIKADRRQEMVNWLNDNRYVVPANSDSAIDRYIFEGAYFLALKLRKGNDAGDIQPIVVRYRSDLAMIPIVLTSIGATEDMGVQSFILGESRAIPRNYRHTVLNYEKIDWFTAGSNYNDVIIAATNEAEKGQSFVTEYAGSSEIMRGLLNFEGRFGSRTAFETETDAGRFVSMLRSEGFAWDTIVTGALEAAFPMPESVAQAGISEEEYYASLDFYLNGFREDNPSLFEDVDLSFDAAALTAFLWERIVVPTQNAGALFDKASTLTRLYTTLSPEEMTEDPVFSFNPDLPDVSNIHEATLETDCDDTDRSILTLPDGRRFFVRDQSAWIERTGPEVPFSRRIELLRDEGAPIIAVDNETRISSSDVDDGGCGCTTSGRPSTSAAWLGLFVVAGLLWRRRRR